MLRNFYMSFVKVEIAYSTYAYTLHLQFQLRLAHKKILGE